MPIDCPVKEAETTVVLPLADPCRKVEGEYDWWTAFVPWLPDGTDVVLPFVLACCLL